MGFVGGKSRKWNGMECLRFGLSKGISWSRFFCLTSSVADPLRGCQNEGGVTYSDRQIASVNAPYHLRIIFSAFWRPAPRRLPHELRIKGSHNCHNHSCLTTCQSTFGRTLWWQCFTNVNFNLIQKTKQYNAHIYYIILPFGFYEKMQF